MVLSDFLSRQKMDDSNPHEIIPISFTLKSLVGNQFYQINNETSRPETSKYLIQLDHKLNLVASNYWKYMALTKV